MASEFTVCDEVTVIADASASFNGRSFGPNVEVSFPDSEWDRKTTWREFETIEEAREAAKTLATELKAMKPKGLTGFFGRARSNQSDPNCVSARQAIEAKVTEWAGEDAVVHSING